MPFTKTYEGSGSTDYSNSLAWALNSIRNANFSWTISGGGTSEYYLRTAGGANPGFAASPPTSNGVYINGTARTKNTLGSLGVNEWGYGDNDTLGYNTVYVRIGSDPDSQAADYVQFRQIPQAGENVRIPSTAGAITDGHDQSAVAILGFYVEDGYSSAIGSRDEYLRVDPDIFDFNSREQAFIDLGAAGITATVRGTGGADAGEFGLYLRGSAIGLLDLQGGSVGIAALSGDTSTVTTIRMSGSNTTLKCGAGVTLTTLVVFDGQAWVHCGATTITKYGGSVYLQESAAITTVNQIGGDFYWGSSGNITTFNARGGSFDMRSSNAGRTLGTLNRYFNGGRIIHNKEAVTITTNTMQDSFTEQIGA